MSSNRQLSSCAIEPRLGESSHRPNLLYFRVNIRRVFEPSIAIAEPSCHQFIDCSRRVTIVATALVLVTKARCKLESLYTKQLSSWASLRTAPGCAFVPTPPVVCLRAIPQCCAYEPIHLVVCLRATQIACFRTALPCAFMPLNSAIFKPLNQSLVYILTSCVPKI